MIGNRKKWSSYYFDLRTKKWKQRQFWDTRQVVKNIDSIYEEGSLDKAVFLKLRLQSQKLKKLERESFKILAHQW